MGKSLSPRILHAGPMICTAPRSGNLPDNTSLRLHNMIVRGRADNLRYWESWSGLKDIQQQVPMVPLTGTLRLNSTNIVNGDGTLFLSECHLGQRICLIPGDGSTSYLITPKRIIADDQMEVWQTHLVNVSGLIGWRMPRLFAINNQRGACLTGNVQKLDRGSLLGVGSGTLYVDGATLSGESMDLDRHPSIARFDPATSTYDVFPLGMDTPAAPTLAAVGGGSKMQGGNYSLVITPARKETVGYNNPSDRADVTISTNDQIAITFPAMDTANGQNAWIVWVTTFADTLGADLNYLNGPWHRLRLIDTSEVSAAGGTINIEYYDAEVEFNELVSFNNDSPTDAEFVENLNSYPIWISCQGQGWNLHPTATSPGPFIVPAKPNNIEAAPLEFAFSSSPPETILGSLAAEGRIYLETINKLQIAQATPDPNVPILIRPYWYMGFALPEQIIYFGSKLYGIPVNGPTRSAIGFDPSSVEMDWAADVYEITKDWNPGQTMIAGDPFNNAVVLFHIADRRNSAGFWTTKWLMYGISQDFWISAGEIGREGDDANQWDSRDNIVCGVATIADRLEILISGREGGPV
jgi:hypothetical protein